MTETTTYTQEQLQAILDAQDERDDLAAKSETDVAAVLEREGHPAWGGDASFDPFELGAPPGEEHAQAAAAPPHKPEPKLLPAAQGQVPEGAEELDQSDLVLPFLSLAAANNAEVTPGKWFLSSDKEGASNGRRVSVLHVAKGREFMAPYKKPDVEDMLRHKILGATGVKIPGDRKVWCSSADRVAPKPTEFGVLSERCDGCQFAAWRTSSTGQRVKPECQETYVALAYDHATDMPCFYKAKGSAIRAWKSLLTLLQMQSRLKKIDGKPAPFAAFELVASSKKDKGKDGDDIIIPVFARPNLIEDPRQVEFLLALKRSIIFTARPDDEASTHDEEA